MVSYTVQLSPSGLMSYRAAMPHHARVAAILSPRRTAEPEIKFARNPASMGAISVDIYEFNGYITAAPPLAMEPIHGDPRSKNCLVCICASSL